MLTADEMSEIVGASVAAEGDEGTGTTTCRYTPKDRSTPYAELRVDWAGGRDAMRAMGLLSGREPGLASPFEGLGDEASAVGSALMVRVGEDLITLTLTGVGDQVLAAKRIVSTMRARMGPSSQPAVADSRGDEHGGTSSDDVAAGLVTLLGRLGERASELPVAAPVPAPKPADPTPPEPTFPSASGLPRRTIPLVKGLTMVLARHEPARGDWEAIATVDQLDSTSVSMTYTADPPDTGSISIFRVVRRIDLEASHRMHGRFTPGDPVEFPGTTALSFSTAAIAELKAQGETTFEREEGAERGLLRRVEPEPVALPIIVNDDAVELPAIHARGRIGTAVRDYYILDDPDNGLMLRVSAGGNSTQMVRLAFPVPSAPASLEERLKADGRVDVYGIYFDFAKSTLRAESTVVLDQIAAALDAQPVVDADGRRPHGQHRRRRLQHGSLETTCGRRQGRARRALRHRRRAPDHRGVRRLPSEGG
ncbi:MAG: hypothetical protein R2712_28460 [Vicinamibacterales bacterium]